MATHTTPGGVCSYPESSLVILLAWYFSDTVLLLTSFNVFQTWTHHYTSSLVLQALWSQSVGVSGTLLVMLVNSSGGQLVSPELHQLRAGQNL